MRSIPSASIIALLSVAQALGCSGSDPAAGGTGGTTTGGSNSTGGVTTGGASAVSTGGFSTGGASVSGGTSSMGGTTSLGGVTSAGGNQATGGTSATGGGSGLTGGSNATGGSSSAGGNQATGGTSAAGGSNGKGGGNATGGTSATGGTKSAGGAGTAFKCDNLRSPAGTAGKAKPAGAVGGLKVLDWAGFQGAVSFTFDDGNTSQITNYSKLHATGAWMTFFLVTGWANGSNAIWKTALTDGHEIGSHTKSHNSVATLADLQAAQDFLKLSLGVTAYTMAAPNGDGSWASVAPQLMIANRGVSNGLIGPRDGTNVFSLPAYVPPTGASSSAMDGEVNAAKTANKWKIFCIHGFAGDSSAYQPLDVTAMTTTMSNAVKNGLWTETMLNVAAYWLGQKAIPASATSSATWTLPAHFPPNMCVRATTTGGTLKQNGVEVPWNDHGYYEISLDAKSVSVE